MLIFGVIYALLPMLTKLELRSQRLVDVHFWCWMIGAGGMAYFMGMAGARGMLRRTLYGAGSQYQPFLVIALISSLLMAIGFLAFLVNVLGALGWRNVLSLVAPDRWLEPRGAEAAAATAGQ